MLVRDLFLRVRVVLFVHRSAFFGVRLGTNASLTIEAVMIVDGDMADIRTILVHAVEPSAHMPRGGVVPECAAFPASAPETDAAIAEAVVNSTVESNVWSPISGVPAVSSTRKSPVTGRPEQTRMRRRNPQARSPEISFGAVS